MKEVWFYCDRCSARFDTTDGQRLVAYVVQGPENQISSESSLWFEDKQLCADCAGYASGCLADALKRTPPPK